MIFSLKIAGTKRAEDFLQMRRNEMAESYPDGITINRMYEAFLVFII